MAFARHGLAVAVVLLLLLGCSPGLSSAVRVPGPQPILGKARARVSAPIGNGFFVHVWTAPSMSGGMSGGICQLITIDHLAAAERPASWPTSGGGGCTLGSTRIKHTRLRAFRWVSIGVALKTGKHAVPTNIEGELVTSASPTRLVARWSGGSHVLTLRHHYFAGGSLAMFGNVQSLTLVAYDRRGHVIAFWQH